MRIHEVLRQARQVLQAAGIPEDEVTRDAEWLARHALGLDRASLLSCLRDEWPSTVTRAALDALVARRTAREPMAYIIGEQEFFGRDFEVGPGVLIPRPETELLVEEALHRLDPARPCRVLDIGTGSGCLAVTLACERPLAQVSATDVSEDALRIAVRNAARHQATVAWHHGTLLADDPTQAPVTLPRADVHVRGRVAAVLWRPSDRRPAEPTPAPVRQVLTLLDCLDPPHQQVILRTVRQLAAELGGLG